MAMRRARESEHRGGVLRRSRYIARVFFGARLRGIRVAKLYLSGVTAHGSSNSSFLPGLTSRFFWYASSRRIGTRRDRAHHMKIVPTLLARGRLLRVQSARAPDVFTTA